MLHHFSEHSFEGFCPLFVDVTTCERPSLGRVLFCSSQLYAKASSLIPKLNVTILQKYDNNNIQLKNAVELLLVEANQSTQLIDSAKQMYKLKSDVQVNNQNEIDLKFFKLLMRNNTFFKFSKMTDMDFSRCNRVNVRTASPCQAKYMIDQIHDVCAAVHAHKLLSFPPYVFWGLGCKCTCFVLKGIFAMLCISLYLQLAATCNEKKKQNT